MKKTGCIVINIGTPKTDAPKDVAIYLNEFLMDKDVINLPFIFRWILVKLIIVPRRSVQSAAKYKSIWLPEGSPLRLLTQKFTDMMQKALPYIVWTVGMRYGEPSVQQACEFLISKGCERILIFPQYPQYAMATTASSENHIKKVLKKLHFTGEVLTVPPFYQDKKFIEIWAKKLQTLLEDHDQILFSFHGLPLNQLQGKFPGCEGNNACCARPEACALQCYRAQSIKTAHLIAEKLNLPVPKYSISFQSRLGRGEWIRPYTDEVLAKMPSQGIKKLCVVTPSFVTDCLETLEEIAIEGKHTFMSAGGQKFTYVSCLNDDPEWVDAAKSIVNEALK